MLDLETLANNNNPVVTSIGAVYFDSDNVGKAFYEVFTFQEQIEAGLSINESTIRWWLDQSRQAQKEINNVTCDTTNALYSFKKWVDEGIKIWGNGAAADNVWLKNLYEKFGTSPPWFYTQDRCYRTIKKNFPLEYEMGGVKHKSVDDAKYQAKHLIAINKKYKLDIL